MESDANFAPPEGCSVADLAEALTVLRSGGVVALPTDTLYGLAADLINERALERIFEIKGRPANLALPVLVGNLEQVAMVADGFGPLLREFVSAFWPGSLTLVLPKSAGVSSVITGGRDTVAVRMPGHWAPLGLANALGRPITGTSANISGQDNLNSLEEIRGTMGQKVGAVVSAGPGPQGLQSTIVDMCGATPELLREGATSFEQVLSTWNKFRVRRAAGRVAGV